MDDVVQDAVYGACGSANAADDADAAAGAGTAAAAGDFYAADFESDCNRWR